MYGKRAIRLGDPTSHGGQVVSVASTYNMFGKNVATIGDKATCPMKDHGGIVTIIEGDPYWTIDGRGVALEGHKCSCGCSLISTLSNVIRFDDGGSGNADVNAQHTAKTQEQRFLGSDADEHFDEQVQAVDAKTQQPIANLAYYIEAPDGAVYSGYTDKNGLCERVKTYRPQELRVWFGDEAEQKN